MTLFYVVGGLFLQFGLPVLASQKWSRLGFVWANVLMMIATMLLWGLFPKVGFALEAVWILVPGINVILLFLAFMLAKILHLIGADTRTGVIYALLLPQWLFLITGLVISLGFRGSHKQDAPD